jgi:hypothetical protein
MAKQTFQPNPRVRQIFEDLEKFKEFCVDYGYKYDEAVVYDMRNYVCRQFNKFLQGKDAKYNWVEPRDKFAERF